MEVTGRGSAAPQKLQEAAFFYAMISANQHNEQMFRFFVSAFLSALRSCAEHKRMFSRDRRFAKWHREVHKPSLDDPTLTTLFKLRNLEVHHSGTGTKPPAKVDLLLDNFKYGSRELSCLHIDLSNPSDENRPDIPRGHNWVWQIEGEPEVINLCGAGLLVMVGVVKAYEAMRFVG
jgi:hypothetical protein